ncbi:MAG: VanZ family protein [Pseudomonadota bacterium]
MNTLAHRSHWLFLGWLLLLGISVLSLLPTESLPDVQTHDKLGHFLAWGMLMAWFSQIIRAHGPLAASLWAYSGAIEVLQGLSGYRDMSGLDLLANGLGILTGWASARRWPDLLLRLDRCLR